MPKVTSGNIVFQRVKKDDDYGIVRKAEVSLAFAVPDGAAEDAHRALSHEIAGDCVQLVNAILARAPGADLSDVPTATQATVSNTTPVTDKDKLAAAAAAPKAAKPPKPPKPPAAPVSSADAASVVEDPTQPPAATAPTNAPTAAAGAAVTDTSAADVTDEDLFTGAAPDVSDKDLTDAITRTNAAIKNAAAIRQLIGKYVSPPGQAKDIDKKLRPKFIEELAKLKPAG